MSTFHTVFGQPLKCCDLAFVTVKFRYLKNQFATDFFTTVISFLQALFSEGSGEGSSDEKTSLPVASDTTKEGSAKVSA